VTHRFGLSWLDVGNASKGIEDGHLDWSLLSVLRVKQSERHDDRESQDR